LYTYASRGQEVVFVNARVAAVARCRVRFRYKARVVVGALARRAASASLLRRLAAKFRSMRSTSCSRAIPGWSGDYRGGNDHGAGRHGDRVTVNVLGWLDIELRDDDL